LKYDQSKLEDFFGSKAAIVPDTEGGEIIRFEFASERLKYSVWLHTGGSSVWYSVDPETHYNPIPLVEISAPCDQITFSESEPSQPLSAVLFWYGSTKEQTNRTLTINKRPDGDLSVWPNVRFPRHHPLHPDKAEKAQKG
jgi:hypothetical protein